MLRVAILFMLRERNAGIHDLGTSLQSPYAEVAYFTKTRRPQLRSDIPIAAAPTMRSARLQASCDSFLHFASAFDIVTAGLHPTSCDLGLGGRDQCLQRI